ncbi:MULTISPECIES: gas vesicle accessory protein GvpU [Vibrio harveyi group]|uniref:gas vesicle accessory protein GvpU n=1 Tax=Vibrio harveyi group TaxID=717610 RepID=UPI00215C6C57|nr:MULTISPECIES: gas vesicle accessory protein GvpU [Vibrio harveyi group]EME0092073.1 hypothetical protein [Vibrio parahaemolyticus]MCR9506952.1 hypothetical protein [Vibrio alginolyticus]
MATEENNKQNQPVANEQQFTDAITDWFLADLVATCNSMGSSYGITLFSSGLIITGQLISGKEYFELLSDLLSNDDNPPENMFVQEKSHYENQNLAEKTVYIHLKNAKAMHSDGKAIPNNGCLWRGQLSHISGFCFGILATENVD